MNINPPKTNVQIIPRQGKYHNNSLSRPVNELRFSFKLTISTECCCCAQVFDKETAENGTATTSQAYIISITIEKIRDKLSAVNMLKNQNVLKTDRGEVLAKHPEPMNEDVVAYYVKCMSSKQPKQQHG